MDEHYRARCATLSGRKRAFPSSWRKAWKLASAVTLSSLVTTIAFQQSIPLSHPHSHLSISRSSTAVKVLADPTNLVKIERKQTVEDRAALEELYLLSSLAKKAMVKTKKRQKKKSVSNPSSKAEMTTSSRLAKRTRDVRQSMKVAESRITAATTAKQSSEGKKKLRTTSSKKKSSLKPNNTLSVGSSRNMMSTDIDAEAPKSTARVQFKGLSTVPNRRNGKKRKTLTPSQSNQIELDTDDYIRSILRKRDEFLSHESRTESASVLDTTDEDLTTSAAYEEFIPNAKPTSEGLKTIDESIHSNMVRNSKSSTMPGFMERTETDRAVAYRNGVKKAQQHASIEFVENPSGKSKRGKVSGQAMYKACKSVPDSLVQFANEIHDVDRITPKEEIILGEKTQEALKLQRIYDGLVTKLEREPTDDEWCAAAGKFNMESIAQTIEEGLEAKNKLVTSNLRMVQGVVNVYIRNGLKGQYNAGDLMQEGIVALIRAAEKFDPAKGFRFSTYAMYWIRAAMKRDQLYQSRVIQVPQRLHETSKRIQVTRKDLTESLKRPPTTKELSNALGMTTAQVERCEAAIAQKMYSLDQQIVNKHKPMSTSRGMESLQSIIASQPDEDESKKLDLVHLRDDLKKALESYLTEEEASVITLRFGMDDDYASSKKAGRTINEVGDLMGLKPDKVRRIIIRSLKKLEISIGDDFKYYRDLSL